MEPRDILIIGEHADGKLKPSTLELVTLARTLAGQDNRRIALALIGDALDSLCDHAALQTGLDILYLRAPGLEYYNGDVYKTRIMVSQMITNATYVIVANSFQGADYASGLAVRLSAACVTGVNGIELNNDGVFLFSRGICGGNFNALIRPHSARTVLTVQPGYFQAVAHEGEPGQVLMESHDYHSKTTVVTGIEQSKASSSGLTQARTIVSAGRGIGDPQNLHVIRRFAALFSGSAVGGSRPLIDMGWLEYGNQVGITGAVVSPDVYIACGISGSSQHIAGMNTAGFVVSINSDPHAAIFNVSDICIVDDLIAFIEAFDDLVESE